MKHPILTGTSLALGLLAAGASLAQPSGRATVRAACAADFQKFCPDAKPGAGGGIKECVQVHLSDFSADCKAAIALMQSARGGGDTAPPTQQGGGGAPKN